MKRYESAKFTAEPYDDWKQPSETTCLGRKGHNFDFERESAMKDYDTSIWIGGL